MNEGWICPVCKAVWSPFVNTCSKPHDGTGAAGVPAMPSPQWPSWDTGTTTISTPNTSVTYVRSTAPFQSPINVYGSTMGEAGYSINALSSGRVVPLILDRNSALARVWDNPYDDYVFGDEFGLLADEDAA